MSERRRYRRARRETGKIHTPKEYVSMKKTMRNKKQSEEYRTVKRVEDGELPELPEQARGDEKHANGNKIHAQPKCVERFPMIV